ncbi:MAG: magnesium/cobalt efflux protein, partial [Rhodobacteraceae bacterium]|nr:magnesium/cobalt efflux protein [Paracoccaceae bacterium]
MGDTDGSSTAAHSAQPHGQNQNKAGVFRRVFGLFNASTPEASHASDARAQTNKAPAHGMINLRRMRVEDVAIPRADIVAVPDTITKTDLVQVFRESGLTRLPVYSGTLDTPVGFAHLKDFALSHGFNGNGGRFTLKRMLRTLLFVPPSMPIGVLLTKMQTERRHMALVIDEYGGVDGL